MTRRRPCPDCGRHPHGPVNLTNRCLLCAALRYTYWTHHGYLHHEAITGPPITQAADWAREHPTTAHLADHLPNE